MAYRFWCGECGYKTHWTSESEGAAQQLAHYIKRHPTIEPGGHVQVNHKNPAGGAGCVGAAMLLLFLFLLLVLLASCHH
ncbi:hypothetical protein ABZ769_24815 [Streptomyces olivoreticuli]